MNEDEHRQYHLEVALDGCGVEGCNPGAGLALHFEALGAETIPVTGLSIYQLRQQLLRRDDLIRNLWLYLGHYAEVQLTTAQKELYYDIANPDGERWWRK